MKPLFALLACTLSVSGAFAQMTGGEKPAPCAEQAISNLSSCLNSNNIVFDMKDDGNGTITITAQGNPPPGQIQSCIAHYNKAKKLCPEAPAVINGTSTNAKKQDEKEGN